VKNKLITTAEKQVHKVITSLKDLHIRDWIAVDHDEVVAIIFPAFMTQFCTNYLEDNWEMTMCCCGSGSEGSEVV
jgi:hypothetical protein